MTVALHASTTTVEDNAHDEATHSAKVSERHVAEDLLEFERAVTRVGRQPDLIRALGAGSHETFDLTVVNQQLKQLVADSGRITAAGLLDVDGYMRATRPHDLEVVGENFRERDYFRGALESRGAYVSEAFRARLPDENLAVAVAIAVRDAEGTALGVLSTVIDLEETQRSARRIAKTHGVSLTITDQRGTVVASTVTAPKNLMPIRNEASISRALAGKAGVIETKDDDGAPQLTAYRPILESGWALRTDIPYQTAQRNLQRLELIVLGSGLALALLLVLGITWFMRVIYRYEEHLRENVQHLERANTRLTRSNNALDTFAHTLVHDLRNPLIAVSGLAEAMTRMTTGADATARTAARHILDSTLRMRQLISDVLELATVSRATPDSELVDLRAVIDDAMQDLDAERLQIGELPEQVHANRMLLSRALKNLLENASAYGRDADETPTARISSSIHEDMVTIHVDDSGTGVDPEDHDRLFRAFERGHAPQTSSGTGLGLAIVAACAEAMGGTISVSTAPELGGARFSLTLPLAPPDPEG